MRIDQSLFLEIKFNYRFAMRVGVTFMEILQKDREKGRMH